MHKFNKADQFVVQLLGSYKTEKIEKVRERYAQFLDELSDVSKVPVRVHEPLNKACLDQLMTVREVSASLQKKREEDTRAAEEAAMAPETKTKPDATTEGSVEQTA